MRPGGCRALPSAVLLLFFLPARPALAQGNGDGLPFEPYGPPLPASLPSVTAVESVEPPSAPFGAPGEVVFSGASGVGGSYTGWSNSQASTTQLTFSPGADVFFARNLSAGLAMSFAYGDGKGYGSDGSLVDTTATTLSGGPRLGYDVALGSAVSWYPRFTLGFEWVTQQVRVVSGGSASTASSALGYPLTTRAGPWLSLDLPLLLHLAPHAFFGFGPQFFQEFGAAQGGPNIGGQRTSVGGAFVVGGWVGGQDPPVPADASPPIVPAKRFGSAGQVIFTSEITVQGAWLVYAGSGSTQSSVSVSPGIDFFPTDHLSLGAGVGGSYSGSTGIDATTSAQVTFEQTAGWFAPRIGVDLPFSSRVSFYPRAYVGFGVESQDEKSAGTENKNSQNYVWVALYAPLLVHPASHVLVGFGPMVSRNLTRTFTFPAGTAQNQSTNAGASLMVGAWL